MENPFLFPNEPTRFTEATLKDVLIHCQRNGASDITFQTNESVIAEIHGRLHKITHRLLSNTEVGDLLNAIYGPNGTAQLLSGQDIDTHYEVKPSRTERFRYRVNGTACMVEGHEGIQITARTIPGTPPNLADLDLQPELLEVLAPEDGVVYVTGATGSGKSTLLASIIKDIAEKEDGHRKILTYESPIEFVFDDVEMPSSVVSQSEIPRHISDFAAGVRNALRRKPRLILVGEARDPETISASLEAALTGHPVYTTLHSTGVAETVRRLVTSYPAEERHGRTIDIVETLRLIIWQKLVPTEDGKRVALREFLVFDEKVRDDLLSVDPDRVTERTRELLQKYGQPMAVDAKKKFDEGIISKRVYQIQLAGSHHKIKK